MRTRRLSTFPLALAGLLIAVPAPAGAKIVMRDFTASIDVKLDLTIDATFESVEKCTPGEKVSGSYDFDFESGGSGAPSKVRYTLINGIGSNTRARSGPRVAPLRRASSRAAGPSASTTATTPPTSRCRRA